jgi:hypothetical protein
MNKNDKPRDRYFRIPDFHKKQHYGKRTPPWIKLHRDRLEEYRFGNLPDAAKAHLLLIELLASRMDNVVPFDAKWVAKKINADSRVDLDLLLAEGFIEVLASTPQASSEQNATLERETEREERERRERIPERDASPSPSMTLVSPDAPGDDAVGLVFKAWAEAHAGRAAETLTPDRSRAIRDALTGSGEAFGGRGYSVQDLIDAIQWSLRDDRTMAKGDHSGKERRDDITDLLRFPDKIRRFCDARREHSGKLTRPRVSPAQDETERKLRRLSDQIRRARTPGEPVETKDAA